MFDDDDDDDDDDACCSSCDDYTSTVERLWRRPLMMWWWMMWRMTSVGCHENRIRFGDVPITTWNEHVKEKHMKYISKLPKQRESGCVYVC